MMDIESLKQFCAMDDFRPAMMRPYQYGEWVCATDGHTGIMLHADIPDLPTDGPNLPGVFPSRAREEPLDINALRAFMGTLPRVDERVNEEVKCEECDGTGETECEECGQDRECPECDGKGTVETKTKLTGRKVPDEEAVVELFGVPFFVRVINKLLLAADVVGCTTAICTSSPGLTQSMSFDLGDARFLMMPCRNDSNSLGGYKIPHKFSSVSLTPAS